MFITDNGILMTCGRGDRGAQGHRDSVDCLKPKLVEDLITQDVIQVDDDVIQVDDDVILVDDNVIHVYT